MVEKFEFIKIKKTINYERCYCKLPKRNSGFKIWRKKWEEIMIAGRQISIKTQQLLHGASKQASSVEEISESVEIITANTQQNAAVSEEIPSNAEELANQAEELKEMISCYFNVGELNSSAKSLTTKNKMHSVHASEI